MHDRWGKGAGLKVTEWFFKLAALSLVSAGVLTLVPAGTEDVPHYVWRNGFAVGSGLFASIPALIIVHAIGSVIWKRRKLRRIRNR